MKSKNLLKIVWLSTSIIIFTTIGLYLFKFGSLKLSDNSEDWVNFANYFSGIINTLFTLINLIILTYISINLVKIEDDRNKWTIQELARPFGSIHLQNSEETIEISIHNIGLGPMIITKFRILDNTGKIYPNFYDLICEIDENENFPFQATEPKYDYFEINSKNGAIGKDQSHFLFKLYFKNDNIQNKEYTELIKAKLNNYTVEITYKDIYRRPIECIKERLLFKPS
ncbi:hypothetical protein ACSV4D_00205 [Flavobacterium sp. ARAG 55.4]|uniref:SMODS-associating 2TM beta-strand rich effector domain-containing protein n=1 Tax=Flavobacterium plantiphilum TaxID=3163297 RepID=A0ABW8XRS9_9FLAO